jgi:Zn-dependent metalloprotease
VAAAVAALGALALGLSWTTGLAAQAAQPAPAASIQSLSDPGERLIVRDVSRRTGFATFASSLGGGAGILLPFLVSAPPEEQAPGFVDLYGASFGLAGRADVQLARAPETDALGVTHVRLRQVYRGITVTAGEFLVHLRGARVVAANGVIVGDMPADVVPRVDAARAQAEARQLVAKQIPDRADGAQYGDPRLEIFSRAVLDGAAVPTRLAWFVEATGPALREYIWIDALTGGVLLHFSQLAEAKSRLVYDGGHVLTLPGAVVRTEGQPTTGDADVDAAYTFAGITYDYYLTNHGRDSYDNAGAAIKSTTHHCPAGYPQGTTCPSYQNAFWDGTQMVYGDGHFFNRFTSDISVIGHELTHGVIQHTCALVYRDQPGALNEHLADAFGALTMQRAGDMAADDPRAWLIGAALVAGRIQGRALRDMLNGGAYNDPVIGKDDSRTHLRDLYTGSEDDGGVHINSGIPNRAFALACRTVPGPAWLTMGPVWYDVMANRIGPRATFAEFAAATLAAATARNASYAATVREAWASVGIDAEAVPPAEPGGGSPCGPELIALLETPGIVRALRAVAGDPAARRATVRFLSRVRRGLSR